MAFAATLKIMDDYLPAPVVAQAAPQRASIDWEHAYPEEQFVRLGAAWRLLAIGAAAVAAWGAIGGIGFTVARSLGAL